MSTTKYGGQYLKIRKAIYETGFDDFCKREAQAGIP